MSQDLINKLLPSIVPGLLGVLRTTAVSREVLGRSLQQIVDDIREGKHIPDSALEQAQLASEIARRLGDRTETANCQLHMGTLERRRHRYKEAIMHFLNAHDTVARMTTAPRAEEKRVRDECAAVLTAIKSRVAELAEEMGEESFLRSLGLLGRPDPR